MGQNSGIETTNHTVNFWIGCTQVSRACDNCFAMAHDHRPNEDGSFMFTEAGWGVGKPRHLCSANSWKGPFRWNRRAERNGVTELVFPNDYSDLFDAEVDPTWRYAALAVLALNPHLTWQILTKRHKVMWEVMSDPDLAQKVCRLGLPFLIDYGVVSADTDPRRIYAAFPMSHLWLGVSAESRKYARARIPYLQDLRRRQVCEVAYIYAEPLTEALHLGADGLLNHIDWVITGGEHADEPAVLDDNDVRQLRDDVVGAGKAFFFKQRWGRRRSEIDERGHDLDGREWRQFPITTRTDVDGPCPYQAEMAL